MTTDPFRWLEEDSPDSLAWQDEQDAATCEYLDRWRNRAGLRTLLEAMPSRGQHVPRRAAAAWFTANGPLVANGVVIVDPGARGESLWDFWPSPDGRHVAVATVKGSAEAGEVRVVDVASGDDVGKPLLFTSWSRLSWLPDSTGFYMNGIDFRGASTFGSLWFWSVRAREAERVDVPDEGMDLYPDVGVDGRYVMVSKGIGALRPAFLIDHETGSCRDFLRDLQGHLHGVVAGDSYLAVTTIGADNGRVVAVPLATPADMGSWREIMPPSDAVLRALSIVDGRVVLSELRDGCSGIRTARLNGTDLRSVRLPNDGVGVAAANATPLPGVPTFRASPGSSTVTFRFSSPASPPAAYAYDVSTDVLSRLDAPEQFAAESRLVVARAGDGTDVRAWITTAAHLHDTPRLPGLVIVYGGWNLPNSPHYSPATAAFVASGGAVVHALVRGGGEYGDAWWQAGRRARKQTTFDDLYAIVDHLIAVETLDPGRVALQGGSAGGLAAAVAAIQRPELFAAVVATAPLLDLLRIADAPTTAASTVASIRDELGDDEAVLRAYSPYQNVHRRLPAMFIGATGDDIRAPAWHARKFVARAHDEGVERPVLLRVWKGIGHGTGPPPGNQISNDWLTFVMHHLSMTPARERFGHSEGSH